MTDQDNGGRAAVTRSSVAGQGAAAPSRTEIAGYIAEFATELARIADYSHLSMELSYLLKMAAVSAGKVAGSTTDEAEGDTKFDA